MTLFGLGVQMESTAANHPPAVESVYQQRLLADGVEAASSQCEPKVASSLLRVVNGKKYPKKMSPSQVARNQQIWEEYKMRQTPLPQHHSVPSAAKDQNDDGPRIKNTINATLRKMSIEEPSAVSSLWKPVNRRKRSKKISPSQAARNQRKWEEYKLRMTSLPQHQFVTSSTEDQSKELSGIKETNNARFQKPNIEEPNTISSLLRVASGKKEPKETFLQVARNQQIWEEENKMRKTSVPSQQSLPSATEDQSEDGPRINNTTNVTFENLSIEEPCAVSSLLREVNGKSRNQQGSTESQLWKHQFVQSTIEEQIDDGPEIKNSTNVTFKNLSIEEPRVVSLLLKPVNGKKGSKKISPSQTARSQLRSEEYHRRKTTLLHQQSIPSVTKDQSENGPSIKKATNTIFQKLSIELRNLKLNEKAEPPYDGRPIYDTTEIQRGLAKLTEPSLLKLAVTFVVQNHLDDGKNIRWPESAVVTRMKLAINNLPVSVPGAIKELVEELCRRREIPLDWNEVKNDFARAHGNVVLNTTPTIPECYKEAGETGSSTRRQDMVLDEADTDDTVQGCVPVAVLSGAEALAVTQES